MTARSSENLAQVLHAAGLFDLEKRARADEFHDFLSSHATPQMVLAADLAELMQHPGLPEFRRIAAGHIRQRLLSGEFDASQKESDEWAGSADGRDTFERLFGGRK